MPSSARWYKPPAEPWGRLSTARRNAGRRPAAGGDWLPPGGRFRGGCAPHSLFGCAKKRMRRARWKRKRRFGALRCSGPPRDGGRRIGACSDLAWPSGTLWVSANLQLPSRGGWCRTCRGGCRIVSASLFAAAGLEVSGSWCSGPMWASAPTGMRRMRKVIRFSGDAEDVKGHPFFRGCGGCERSLTFCGDTESHRFSGKPRAIVFVGMWKAICFSEIPESHRPSRRGGCPHPPAGTGPCNRQGSA